MKPSQSALPSPGSTKNGESPVGLLVLFQVYAAGLRSGTLALVVQPMLPWLSMIAQFWLPYPKSPSAVKASSTLLARASWNTARISWVRAWPV